MRACVLVVVGACSFSPHATGDGGVTGDASDARIDGGIDATLHFDGAPGLCFGTGDFTVCLDALPTTNAVLGGVVDTTACNTQRAAVVTQPTGELCVIAGTSVSVDVGFGAFGARPLVLVATSGDLSVSQPIDVSSHADGTLGAGGNASACDPSTPGGDDGGGGGGGAGGSFGSAGAAGGAGKGGMGGAGGQPGQATPAGLVRGGCAGSKGGAGGTGGAGGNGGGGVYLIATHDLTLNGSIDASGQGGRAGTGMKAGGGGGGSGGLIALFAGNQITVNAQLFANGAGAGAGTDSGSGLPGAESPAYNIIGGGGNGPGPGGDGAIEGVPATAGAQASKGGGGGGGGLGVIVVVSGQSISGQFSPAAQ